MSDNIGSDPKGTAKLDGAATLGLEGVEDSLAYRVHEIEKHIHNYEKWFGAALVPNAEIHVADRMAGGISPFRLTAGNDDFGNWVQVLGSSDTPVQTGMVKVDLHRLIVIDTNATDPFIIQIITGESAGFAAKLVAEDFDEVPYVSATNNNDSGVTEIIDKRCIATEKVWMRCAAIGSSGSVFDFYFGIHEYIG